MTMIEALALVHHGVSDLARPLTWRGKCVAIAVDKHGTYVTCPVRPGIYRAALPDLRDCMAQWETLSFEQMETEDEPGADTYSRNILKHGFPYPANGVESGPVFSPQAKESISAGLPGNAAVSDA